MIQQDSKEELLKDWWLKWYEADYSWDGLKNHEWTGHEIDGWPATLQDYWRDQENDLLTAPNGKQYTRVHFPMMEEDGITPTKKADWSDEDRQKLHDNLKTKLADFGETKFHPWGQVVGLDNRTQLQGSVFLCFDIEEFDLPTKPNTEQGLISISCRWSQSFFGEDAVFRKTAFLGISDFDQSTFSGGTNFSNAAFSDYADFRKTTFSDFADFTRVTFRDHVDFSRVTFSNFVEFSKVTFLQHADFRKTSFLGEAYFVNARFSRGAYFINTFFSVKASFFQAIFMRFADFDKASFLHKVDFVEVAFTGYSHFEGAFFSEGADFSETAFSGKTNFMVTTFLKDVNFEGRARELIKDEEHWPFDLNGAKEGLTGKINLPNSILPKAHYSFAGFDFGGAIVLGNCNFQNRDFLGKTRFDHALFGGVVEFQGGKNHQGVSYFGADFESVFKTEHARPLSHKLSAKPAGEFTEMEAAYVAYSFLYALAKSVGGVPESSKQISRQQFYASLSSQSIPFKSGNRKVDLDAWFARIERAFRKLKLSMEEIRNKTQEQEFYRMELLARRRRRDDQVPKWEYEIKPFIWLKYFGLGKSRLANWGRGGISHAFQWASEFGGSIAKPIKHLSWCAFWVGVLVYLGLILSTGELPTLFKLAPLDARLGQAFGFSISNIFPFGGFGEARDLLLKPKEGEGYSWWNAGFGFIATVQSLFSLIMIFLSGLAIRRRFQIS